MIDIPAVVAHDVFLAIAAHGASQPLVTQQKVRGLDEFISIRVEEPGVALQAMVDQYLAARVAQHGRADGHRLER